MLACLLANCGVASLLRTHDSAFNRKSPCPSPPQVMSATQYKVFMILCANQQHRASSLPLGRYPQLATWKSSCNADRATESGASGAAARPPRWCGSNATTVATPSRRCGAARSAAPVCPAAHAGAAPTDAHLPARPQPKLQNHIFSCRGCNFFTCIDCSQTFDRNTVQVREGPPAKHVPARAPCLAHTPPPAASGPVALIAACSCRLLAHRPPRRATMRA